MRNLEVTSWFNKPTYILTKYICKLQQIYLDEIQDELLERWDVFVSISTLSHTLHWLSMTHKHVANEVLERNELLHTTWQAAYADIPASIAEVWSWTSVQTRTSWTKCKVQFKFRFRFELQKISGEQVQTEPNLWTFRPIFPLFQTFFSAIFQFKPIIIHNYFSILM